MTRWGGDLLLIQLPSFLNITEAKSKQWNLPVASPLTITSPECWTTLYLPLQPGLMPILLVPVSLEPSATDVNGSFRNSCQITQSECVIYFVSEF